MLIELSMILIDGSAWVRVLPRPYLVLVLVVHFQVSLDTAPNFWTSTAPLKRVSSLCLRKG